MSLLLRYAVMTALFLGAMALAQDAGTITTGGGHVLLDSTSPPEAFLKVGGEKERDGYILAALSIYRMGVEFHPHSAKLLAAKQRLEKQLDQGIADGTVHVDRAPTKDEPSAATMVRQAAVYEKNGLSERAQELLEAALKKDPENSEAKKMLAELKQKPAPGKP